MRISDQEANQLRLLKAIRRAEPVSRTQLVQLTGLSTGAISELTADLVRRQFLIEEKTVATGRGRPRVQLRLNPDSAHVVGVSILPDSKLYVGIVNLRGDVVFERTHPISRSPTIAATAEDIAALVDHTIAASPFDREDIHSVGVSLPGTVDSIRGSVHWLQTYPEPPSPFAAIIAERLCLPVFLDNSSDVVARAEHWFGADRQLDDFCLVMVGLGLGFAQYVDGMPWTGPRGLNPEFAHLKIVDEGGPQCVCGAAGCLMAYASVFGIISRICEQRGLERPPHEQWNEMFEQCVDDARNGDQATRAIFDRAGNALGTAIANHINVWDPARLIILCPNAVIPEMIGAPLRAALRRNTFPAFKNRTAIEFRVEEEARYSKGAAALVLEQLYRVGPNRRGRT